MAQRTLRDEFKNVIGLLQERDQARELELRHLHGAIQKIQDSQKSTSGSGRGFVSHAMLSLIGRGAEPLSEHQRLGKNGYLDEHSREGLRGWFAGKPEDALIFLERDGKRDPLDVSTTERPDLAASGISGTGFSAQVKFAPGSHKFRIGVEKRATGEINYLPHSGTLSIEHYLFVGNPTTALTASLPTVSALAALRPIERAPDVLFVIGCWDGESKRYRVYNIADGLERLCLRVVVIRFEDVPNIVSNDIRPKVVVFFREPLMPGCGLQEAIDHVKSWGGKTIFDIDDYVFEPDIIGQIDGVKALNALEKEQYTDGVHMYRALLLACDKVTVTTEVLAARVRALGRAA